MARKFAIFGLRLMEIIDELPFQNFSLPLPLELGGQFIIVKN